MTYSKLAILWGNVLFSFFSIDGHTLWLVKYFCFGYVCLFVLFLSWCFDFLTLLLYILKTTLYFRNFTSKFTCNACIRSVFIPLWINTRLCCKTGYEQTSGWNIRCFRQKDTLMTSARRAKARVKPYSVTL